MTQKTRQTRVAKKATTKALEPVQAPAPPPAPGKRTKAAIAHATARNAARRRRVEVRGDVADGTLHLSPCHSDQQGFGEQYENALGSTTPAFQNRLLVEIRNVTGTTDAESDANVALAILDGVQPENEIEALLAAQMAATHSVAMHMLAKARRAEYLEHMNSYGGLATKLLRTFTAQTEALAKLRRGGEQKVTVEHVHVYHGGQAIVGNVNHPGGTGGVLENQSQPHEPIPTAALAFDPGSPVWSEEQGREPVPVASGEG